ncbi:helix-turn-helix domain-containing protein [Lysinibacillus sp. NPDC093712]|uniref:helix-turn-helix domain-containing protein n=1 Tax=Lysinibacillus sp. NPDC093712 TaxID=3390579 RepID=UPI003D022F41
MQNNEKEIEAGLTLKEVAETLNIAESTVYKYIEKGLLEEVEQPNLKYTVNGQRLFNAESVLNLKAQMSATSDHISLNSYAKEKKVSPELLKRIIADNDIEIPMGYHGLRQTYLISPEIRETLDQLILENNFSHFRTKSNYYNSKLNIALLQPFVDENGRTYRIMIEGRRWGFYTETGFIEYGAIKDIQPLYDIHKPTVRSTLYVNFSIPKNEKNAYLYVDAIYNIFGIENAQLILTDESINGRIKMNNWKVASHSEHIDRLLELNNYTHNGEVKLIDHVLHVVSFDKRVVVVLPAQYHERLSELANKQNTTDSKMGQKIIQDFLNKQQE